MKINGKPGAVAHACIPEFTGQSEQKVCETSISTNKSWVQWHTPVTPAMHINRIPSQEAWQDTIQKNNKNKRVEMWFIYRVHAQKAQGPELKPQYHQKKKKKKKEIFFVDAIMYPHSAQHLKQEKKKYNTWYGLSWTWLLCFPNEYFVY
jgi:hypothetical protein